MNASGLNQGTSGNISVRYGDSILITPRSVRYDHMEPEMIATMPIEGEYGAWSGPMRPTSKWRFHLNIAQPAQCRQCPPHVLDVLHYCGDHAAIDPSRTLHDGGFGRTGGPLRRISDLWDEAAV